MTTATLASPDSVVARIVAELQHNPDAKPLLLRSLLSDDLLELPPRVNRIDEQLYALTEQVVENRRLIAENSRQIAALTERVDALTEKLDDLIEQVAALTQKVGGMDGTLNNLVGDQMERKVHANIHSILSQRVQMPFRVRKILKSVFIAIDGQLSDALYDAADAGLIDDAARTGAFATDLIVGGGRRGERENIYFVAEVSRTINNDDIARAYERARTIATATGAETIAAAIGGIAAPPQTRLADELGVQLLIATQLQE